MQRGHELSKKHKSHPPFAAGRVSPIRWHGQRVFRGKEEAREVPVLARVLARVPTRVIRPSSLGPETTSTPKILPLFKFVITASTPHHASPRHATPPLTTGDVSWKEKRVFARSLRN